MGTYVIQMEGSSPEDETVADVGVVLEGVEVLQNLRSVTFGRVMLFGLIIALNISHPKYKFFFSSFTLKIKILQ